MLYEHHLSVTWGVSSLMVKWHHPSQLMHCSFIRFQKSTTTVSKSLQMRKIFQHKKEYFFFSHLLFCKTSLSLNWFNQILYSISLVLMKTIIWPFFSSILDISENQERDVIRYNVVILNMWKHLTLICLVYV